MKSIQKSFPVTEEEYELLHKKFGKYCYYIAWQLKRNNTKNNSTDDFDDITQQLQIALIRAASYYKRQCYIEASLESLKLRIKDEFNKKILQSLEKLWNNRTRHGANRQKFGEFQEMILDGLLKKYVPKKFRPDKEAQLVMDSKFATYCKQIAWNEQRSMGKKITREKSFRAGMTSLSEYDYLAYI